MIGKTLSHFRIIEKLGAGGMGVVYRAHDEQLDRDVAIKVLPSAGFDDASARTRLLREARTASKLNHPHICTIHEVGEHEGQAFIAMELVEGLTLSALLEGGPLPVEHVQRYGLQLAEALAHAHERGIIHRDLKSANVIVTPDGRAKVLDFGLAKRQSAGDMSETATRGSETVTAPGMVVGTLAYMAPEQLRGRPADARSDIWSLGVVLYEMAAGVRPFQGSTGFELSSAIMNQAPPPLATGPTGPLPPGFGTIIERCLEKEPDQRYQQCTEVRAALEAVQSGGAVPVWAGRKRRISRRVWLSLAAGLGTVLVTVIAVLMGLNLEGVRDRLLGGAQAPKFRSIAVLPVANLSGDPAEEYYADGMTYTLIATVSQIGSLRVIERGSVMPYKGTKKPLSEIARDLNVDTVLDASVAREGGRVHVTAQLIDAAAARNLWADAYDRPATDVLRLQSEVAREIARKINVTLTPEQAKRLTSSREVDPKLYEAYVRGKFYVSQNTQESFEKGMRYLRQAVDIDPAEPLTWVGLAEGYIALGHGGAELIDIFPKAKAAAEQALKLDPDAAEAEGVLAEVALYYDWDWVKAERLIKHALEVNPSLAATHYHYAWYLALFNRLDEAIVEHKLARDHAPLQPANTGWLGGLYNYAGRYDEAIIEAKKAIELDPKFWPSYRVLSTAYSHKGMHPEAIAAAQRIIELSPFIGNAVLGAAYALAGQREQALAIAGRLEGTASQRPQRLSELYAALGDRNAMFRGLEAAYEARVTTLPWIRVHGGPYDSVRDDPRFQNLLRGMKLPL